LARGERVLPPISRELLNSAGQSLKPEELPILGMTLEGITLADMAAALGREPTDVSHMIDRMIKRLKIEIPAPRG
jgi:DNA-binding MarR family transcriptional regulator